MWFVGAPSTYLRISTEGKRAWVGVHRADPSEHNSKLRQTVELN